MTELHIPEVDDDSDTLGAALAYARAGWYVLPVDQATKHAGSVLGKGWPSKSSRDPEQIIAWFAGTDDALALHVGRSGAIVFDVDRPEALPSLMVAALGVVPGPFQSTREGDERRGHYFYAAPPGRVLGNRLGGLGKGWGEVRGKNGIVVVAPSTHEKKSEGGRYHWVRTGSLPLLPQPVAAELPDAGDSADAATDGEVRAFLDRHTARERPELLHGVLTQVATALATGESRHGIALRATAGAMREAAAGLYPALEAATALLEAFTRAMATSRDGSERTLTWAQARGEFMGILAWAVAQVHAADLAAVRADVDTRLAPGDALAGLIAPQDRTAEPPPFGGDTFLPEVAKSQVDDPLGAAEAARERTSWWPRGLGSIVTGVEEEPPPAVLARLDGARLFYARKVNALLGESESGKTWVALLAVVQTLAEGGTVVYLDFEDTASGIVGRARALGIPDDVIVSRLSYIGPDEVLHAAASEDLREHLAAVRPALIVLDGWNAAMTLLGLNLESNTDATRFAQMLLKPLAATGAAVVAIDHVPKNKENRGKGGIGAQAKRAMLTGCAITVEVAEPFGRGMTGRLRLHVDKDRAGHVRAVSAEAKFAGTAILESDANTGKVTVSIRPPDMGTRTEREQDRRAPLMEAICGYLQGNPQAPQNEIYRNVEGRQSDVKEALEELVRGEYVVRRKAGQAYLHTVVRLYSPLAALAGMSGLPVSVPSGHGGHGAEKPAQKSDTTVSARFGTRLGHGSDPQSNRVPPPPFRGADTVDGEDERDPSDLIAPTPWILVGGERVDPRTGELLDTEGAT
ncbi:hypothetical protein Ssi03_25690 [Sphaerisporangium siamense]|uniref:DNA primase/polymerase bifunctional N-terminal domain-containing protein n=1 Tax=Sphaerisporangium siamense TaxID=795645 RepID=A0A7W7G918_9ACTN|nr:bifunctional DNA primase/polymerase [Sphaerisporangium siamense]MBB4700105.1 hypothetical protein [Sphaerisporangium siamense]GII84579.1 hypothetical protein Ssi03_25690 [Sphaerisporangium siamense]